MDNVTRAQEALHGVLGEIGWTAGGAIPDASYRVDLGPPHIPVSDVVGRRVKLKKSGREWKGLSPFNREKTASFFVNDHKGSWFYFSAGKNGDIFGFVMETEGLSFPEAVERLAGMAGLPMPVASRDAEVREERRKTLYDVLELAAKFFEATLASRAGAHARGEFADLDTLPRQIKRAAVLIYRLTR